MRPMLCLCLALLMTIPAALAQPSPHEEGAKPVLHARTDARMGDAHRERDPNATFALHLQPARDGPDGVHRIVVKARTAGVVQLSIVNVSEGVEARIEPSEVRVGPGEPAYANLTLGTHDEHKPTRIAIAGERDGERHVIRAQLPPSCPHGEKPFPPGEARTAPRRAMERMPPPRVGVEGAPVACADGEICGDAALGLRYEMLLQRILRLEAALRARGILEDAPAKVRTS